MARPVPSPALCHCSPLSLFSPLQSAGLSPSLTPVFPVVSPVCLSWVLDQQLSSEEKFREQRPAFLDEQLPLPLAAHTQPHSLSEWAQGELLVAFSSHLPTSQALRVMRVL